MAKVKDKNNIEWREFELDDFDLTTKQLKDKFKEYTFEKFSLILNSDGCYSNLVKTSFDKDKLLTEEESNKVKLCLCNCGLIDEVNKKIKEGRKLIHKELMPAKNDYKHDSDRGTVYYTNKCRNYSHHNVIIPDGMVIKDSNFSQRLPHTKAIQGENLTFVDCNLTNVDWHSSWIRQGTNNTQIRMVIKEETEKLFTVSIQVEEDPKNNLGVFKEVGVKQVGYEEEEKENIMRRYEVEI